MIEKMEEDSDNMKKAKDILATLSGMKYSEVCNILKIATLIAGEQAILN